MRKIAAFLAFVGLFSFAAAFTFGEKLPKDIKEYMEKGIFQKAEVSSGWDALSRAPLGFVDYALEKTYGRRASKIWPLVGKDGTLVAYAIDLEGKTPKNVVYGMGPATAVIISSSLSHYAVIGELHGPHFAELLPCKAPEKIVLTQGTALASKCGSRWLAGYGRGKEVSPEWVEKNAERPFPHKGPVSALPPSWTALLSGDSSGRVFYSEFDTCYPIDHNNGSFGVDAIGYGDPHGDTHNSAPGHYWNYDGDYIQMIGLISGYAKLVFHGEKYGFKEAPLQDVRKMLKTGRNINQGYYTADVFHNYWVNLGIYWPTGDTRLIPTFEKTPISEDYYAFGERNKYFWNTHRFFNTGVEVVVPFLSKYGKYVNENSIRPPFRREVGVSAARDAWFTYFKERLLKRGVLIDDALDKNHQPYGIPDSIAPEFTIAGWDDSKKLTCVFVANGAQWIGGPGGSMTIPPGYSWWSPERLADYPAFLYPPKDYTDTPPALTFPTRATVKEWETLTFTADLAWDREGEAITWEIEECPFTVTRKGNRSFSVLADRPEGNYVIWIKYTDGKNTIHHPIVVHVFPTLQFGD